MFHDESLKIITYILGSSQQQSNINSHKSLTHSEAYQSDRHHTSVESSRSNWIRLSRSSLEERPNSIATFNRQYIQHKSLDWQNPCSYYTQHHGSHSATATSNKYIGPPYCRVEIYTDHVACCPLVSHGEYADRTDGWTEGRQTVITLRFPRESIMIWWLVQCGYIRYTKMMAVQGAHWCTKRKKIIHK